MTILIILGIFIILYVVVKLISKIECENYEINYFDVSNDKIKKNMKIVFISDFHNKCFACGNEKLIDDIMKLEFDYVVLGGDIIDFSINKNRKNEVEFDYAIEFIEMLAKRVYKKYGKSHIFYGMGNHELRLRERTDNNLLAKSFEKLKNCLKDNNVVILDNSFHKIDDNVFIYGLSLYDGYYGKIFSNTKNKSIEKEVIDKTFAGIDNSKFNIMVFHNLDFAEDLINYGYDLVLSGHYHGGLIRLPIVGCVFSPDFELFPKYHNGLYNIKDGRLIVSRGLGEHFIKIRVNNRPEVCVLNIVNGK